MKHLIKVLTIFTIFFFFGLQNVFSDDVTCAGGSASSSMGCGIGESRVPNGIVDPILETTRCTANGLSGCLSATPMGVGCAGVPVANF